MYMFSLFHKLRWVCVAVALAWVVAPLDMAAAQSLGGVENTAGPIAASHTAGHQHDHMMIGCCDSKMQESCATSGMAGCATGGGALLIADQAPKTDLADNPCAVFRQSALAALSLSSDPPPPRI